ncbi:MAG TPA: pyridoxamine 5'-phosphate oxidase family protein [Aeromicrobium sp.]|nr:pyridoxamine 5'-phosphate oxidase family protein [Aeromicrobium sp.]
MWNSVELNEAECRRLLRGATVGRVALRTPDGLRVIPVNYAARDDAIYFRTTPESVVGLNAPNAEIAFEIDNVDYEYHRGWSVVAHGIARSVADPDELQELDRAWGPQPWADGPRPLCVRLRWSEITGRRLGPFPRSHDLPVDRVLTGGLRSEHLA